MLAPKFLTLDWQLYSVIAEFAGAADTLVEAHSEPRRTMNIAPYEVDVLAWGRRRGWGRRANGRESTGLSAELRILDSYLASVRRAQNGECDEPQAHALAG